MTSQRRVFYPSGSSTAFTRSIGDRDAGGVIISKPEINSIEAPVQVCDASRAAPSGAVQDAAATHMTSALESPAWKSFHNSL